MASNGEGFVVRVRGLPLSASAKDIAAFFEGEAINFTNCYLVYIVL